MKAKDVLRENKRMRFECDAGDVPEIMENTYELPKYNSAPLIKQKNTNTVEVMEHDIQPPPDFKCPNCDYSGFVPSTKRHSNLHKYILRNVTLYRMHSNQMLAKVPNLINECM